MKRLAARDFASAGAAWTDIAHAASLCDRFAGWAMVAAMTTSQRETPSFAAGEVLTPVVGAATLADLAVGRTAIGIDHDGNVWFAGAHDLVRLENSALTSFRFGDEIVFSGIAAGPSGVVYFASSTGLVRFTSGAFTLLRPEGVGAAIRHLATSPTGEAVFATFAGDLGVIGRYDGRALRVMSPAADFPPSLEITALGFDEAGELVIGAAGAVAVRRDDTWSVIRGLDATSTFAPTIDEIVTAAGAVWFASPAGVYEYRGGRFTLHRTERPVVCLCVDDDELWFGMRTGGLGRLLAGEVSVFQPGGTLLPHEDVTDLVRGADGRIWVLAGGGIAFIREGEIERLSA